MANLEIIGQIQTINLAKVQYSKDFTNNKIYKNLILKKNKFDGKLSLCDCGLPWMH